MAKPAEPPRYTLFLEGGDIAAFKELLGPAAADFDDRQLPQLRREIWGWANFLLDLYESGNASCFDSGSGAAYDEGNDHRRDRNSNNPKQ